MVSKPVPRGMPPADRAEFELAWTKHKTKGWLDLLEGLCILRNFRVHEAECLEVTKGEKPDWIF